MNPNFKKLALAAGISASLGAATLPAHAVMLGDAGEALLVPLVRHGGDLPGATNTYINVTVPGTVGFDTIPNFFTAPHTTPTNPGPTLFPDAASLQGGNSIHWYWFDTRSVHRLNGEIPVTADDVVTIDWLEASNGAFAGEAGYMVIGTETARTRAAADFAMFGEAYYEIYSPDPFNPVGTLAPIPVLPMSDGADGAFDSVPSMEDNVKYTASGIPRAVSPLASGMRTNRSDGILDDTTVFDLSLGDRNFPSVHVVWLDTNLNSRGRGINVDVYDSEELSCSDSIDLPDELNYIRINNWANQPEPEDYKNYCLPAGSPFTGATEHYGYVTYYVPEYIDTGINEPESAGVAFSITMDWDANDVLRFTTSDVKVRGTYK